MTDQKPPSDQQWIFGAYLVLLLVLFGGYELLKFMGAFS